MIGAFPGIQILASLPWPESAHGYSCTVLGGQCRSIVLQLDGGREEKAIVSVAADATRIQLHTLGGKYLDLADYTSRLSAAKEVRQVAEVRRLQPVQKAAKARVAL